MKPLLWLRKRRYSASGTVKGRFLRIMGNLLPDGQQEVLIRGLPIIQQAEAASSGTA